MRQKSLRLLCVWLFAASLVAPSLGACACAIGCAMGTCSFGSHGHADKPATPSDHHGPGKASPAGHSDEQDGKCGDDGPCGCGCTFNSADGTIPAAPAAQFVPTLPVLLFVEPAPKLHLELFTIEDQGFHGYDSGPPTDSLRLPVKDRSPPVLRA